MNVLRGCIVVFWLGVLLAILMDLPAPFDRMLQIAGVVIAILHALELVGFLLDTPARCVSLARCIDDHAVRGAVFETEDARGTQAAR